MRKIRGFKLSLRPHEIRRRAKKAGLDLESAGLPEPALDALLERAAKALAPGVLFDTFGHPDPDQPILSPMPGLAYSLVLASIGDGFLLFRVREPGAPEALWPLLEEAALDECVRFAAGLLADEAEKDQCELSPLTALSGAASLEAVLRKLDGAKLGVGLREGRLSPAASLAVSLSWLAKSKAKSRK
ncbi:MAG: hypothetical protein HY552_02600 [Elusimicrobia bacterium]|nr:hypothetical protein [Elusimicrobiota bacterium]